MCDEITESPKPAPTARYEQGVVGRGGRGLVVLGEAWTVGRGLVIRGGAW